MKTSILIFSIAVYLLLSPISRAQAQWQSDVRLTDDTAVSNFPFVAVSGSVVHVVWTDNRDGNYEVYYKRSSDGGANWSGDMRLTNAPGDAHDPFAAVSGQNVYAVWRDNRDGNYEIYFKRSGNGGLNWTADTRLTNDPGNSAFAFPAAFGSKVHIVWFDSRNGNDEIFYKRSEDYGITWTADTPLTNDPAPSNTPSIAASGSNLHVVWRDYRDGNYEIYYKRSSDGGVTWGNDYRLTNDPAASFFAYPAVSGSYVHVVWYDNRDGNNEIYYKRSSNGGLNWGPDTRLTNDPADSHDPFIAASVSNVHVVWRDNRDGNNEIYYKHSADYGSTWGEDTRLTNATGNSAVPSIAVSGSVLHVVWHDNRNGNNEIYYKQGDEPVGIVNISSEIPAKFNLDQNCPNPFNPVTKFKVEIAKTSEVKIVVFDVLGREITTLVNEQLKAGTYEIDFDGTNYASGIYYYQMLTGDFTETKKMVLIK